jgi:hypothetical protein
VKSAAGVLGLRAWYAAGFYLALVALCGCPPVNSGDGNTDSNTPDTNDNGTIDTATALDLSGNHLAFTGVIGSDTDTDVYRLGTFAGGDHLTVDVQARSGTLDAVAAIFDASAHLVAFNDDRASDSSDINPRLDFGFPSAEEGAMYLGIIAYPGSGTSGNYVVTIDVTRDGTPLQPHAQILYLDWAGGANISIPNVGNFDLPAFSASQVGLPASQTAALKARVQAIVEDRYAGYNLTVLNSDDNGVPSAAHSTAYFGSEDPRAFAISEQVDSFNQDPSDDCIIYTGSFRGAFIFTPTFEQMAQALGNTVAHECGHLLGLVHTADCADMMDTTCYNERILTPQQFSTATIDASVFTFGLQPEQDILTWVLGLAGM